MKEIEGISNEEYYNKCLKANRKLLELLSPQKRLLAKYRLMFDHIEALYEDIKLIKRAKKEIEKIKSDYEDLIK